MGGDRIRQTRAEYARLGPGHGLRQCREAVPEAGKRSGVAVPR